MPQQPAAVSSTAFHPAVVHLTAEAAKAASVIWMVVGNFAGQLHVTVVVIVVVQLHVTVAEDCTCSVLDHSMVPPRHLEILMHMHHGPIGVVGYGDTVSRLVRHREYRDSWRGVDGRGIGGRRRE